MTGGALSGICSECAIERGFSTFVGSTTSSDTAEAPSAPKLEQDVSLELLLQLECEPSAESADEPCPEVESIERAVGTADTGS